MFCHKLFQLYGYQREIQRTGRNKQFSKLINRALPHGARETLDDLFYRISTDRVINPTDLTPIVRTNRTPEMTDLKIFIDDLIDMAQLTLKEGMAPAAKY